MLIRIYCFCILAGYLCSINQKIMKDNSLDWLDKCIDGLWCSAMDFMTSDDFQKFMNTDSKVYEELYIKKRDGIEQRSKEAIRSKLKEICEEIIGEDLSWGREQRREFSFSDLDSQLHIFAVNITKAEQRERLNKILGESDE